MYGCESWTVKKAECRRIDAFEPWCWRRLLRVLWTARRSNQSILKEISPGCSLEGLMLKPKLQYFGHLMQSWLIGKHHDAGRDWGQEEKGTAEDKMAGWHDCLMDMGLDGLWELMMDKVAWHATIHGVAKSQTWPRNWTELNWLKMTFSRYGYPDNGMLFCAKSKWAIKPWKNLEEIYGHIIKGKKSTYKVCIL